MKSTQVSHPWSHQPQQLIYYLRKVTYADSSICSQRTVTKLPRPIPRDSIRLGLPSKGRMAEDTMQLLKVSCNLQRLQEQHSLSISLVAQQGLVAGQLLDAVSSQDSKNPSCILAAAAVCHVSNVVMAVAQHKAVTATGVERGSRLLPQQSTSSNCAGRLLVAASSAAATATRCCVPLTVHQVTCSAALAVLQVTGLLLAQQS